MDYSSHTNKKRKGSGKSQHRRRRNSIGVTILRVFIIVFVIGGFAVGGALLGAYAGIIGNAPTLNTKDVVPENYTSIIYDQNGNEIDKLHGDENREYVKISQIPKYMQDAVVSIEDERFFSHNGIDMKGIFRAIAINLRDHDLSQGASTITQQLIKNEVLTTEKKFSRKIQEQYLAVKFENQLTDTLGSKEKAKEYILELYLNTISLNHGLNGVEAAAKFYYGKSVSELTLAECTSIAGITKNPSAYSPVSFPENNKKRQMTVLGKMLELGKITQAEYDQAKAEDIYSKIVGKKNTEDERPAAHSYFTDQLVYDITDRLMKEKEMSEQQAKNMIYSGGLKIYSTEDPSIQSVLEESYKNDALFPPKGNTLDVDYKISVMDIATEEQSHYNRKATVSTKEAADAFVKSVQDEILNDSNKLVLDDVSISESLQSAMVIIDYHTGQVKALIGGRGEKHGDLVFNRATQALRQPGSCFKVLAGYAPAIDTGIMMPGTTIVDEPFEYNGWTPKNWYKGYRGQCTVRDGIRDSLNILAAKTIVEVGVDTSFEYLKNFGFTSLVESETRNGKVYSDKTPAAVLGGITDGVSVMELTAAYGTIANKGVYLKPTTFTKVLDHSGNVLLEYVEEPKRVLKETTAFMLTDMMEDVISGGGTGRLAQFKQNKMPIAGKTGTTTDDKDLTFAGYTPYYVGGIWLGYDNPRPMTYDRSYHLLLWSDVMDKIHSKLEYKTFEKPEGVVSKTYCSVSGKSPISGVCEHDYYGGGVASDYCTVEKGSDSSGSCTLHKAFTIDKETGYAPSEFCPADSVGEVILAIDPKTNEILNKPSTIPSGKLDIHLNETCPIHNGIIGAPITPPDQPAPGANPGTGTSPGTGPVYPDFSKPEPAPEVPVPPVIGSDADNTYIPN